MSDEPRVVASFPIQTLDQEFTDGSQAKTVTHMAVVWSNGRVERVPVNPEQFDTSPQIIRPGRGNG